MSALAQLECQPGDRFRGVSLQDYLPRAATEGKWRSTVLLAESFGRAPDHPVARLVDRAVEVLGPEQVVWRVRAAPQKPFSWELYFWSHAATPPLDALLAVLEADHRRLHPQIDVERLRAIAPLCLSIDLTPASSPPDDETVSTVSLYLDLLPNTAAYYTLTPGALTFQGAQTRYDEGQHAAFLEFVHASPHAAGVQDLGPVLPDELEPCNWRYLAHKPDSDGIYRTGLDIHQFRWFVRRFGFPTPFADFVDAEHRRLDHLTFDVGYNFTSHQGSPQLGSASFYGCS